MSGYCKKHQNLYAGGYCVACANETANSESTETAGYAEIHAAARETTARQTFKAMTKTDRPDIAIAILLRAIDDWYEKGLAHGKRA